MFLRQVFRDASEQQGDALGPPPHYRQLCAGRYESVSSLVLLPGATIARERINVSVMQETETRAPNCMFIFPLAAIGGWRINGHHEQESVIALRQGSTELMTAVGAQSDLIALTLGPELLPPPLLHAGTVSFRRAPSDSFLIDWIDSLIELCASGFEFSEADGRLLSELLAERLMDLVDRLDDGRCVDLLAGSAYYDVFRRVQTLIDRLPEEPVTLAALTGHLGVPMAEIRASIRQCTGLSPAAWLGCYRLDGARRDLLSAWRHGRRISDIAMSWGFYHLGRFSCGYHRHFEETPRATIARGGARR